ncbi:hypothetical protein RB653_001982 [Dictyostelium firmibasis]|uniref:Uncharacterized protein n=1 Tax=Dictyostelium firmibasis TaxID=79012 RepID=A0AAN7TXS4_9MYCE
MISRASLNKCITTFSKLKCNNNNTLYRNTRLFTTDANKVDVKVTNTVDGTTTEVTDLVERISKLSLLEVMDLTSRLQKKLGVPDIDFSNFGSGPAAGAAPAAAAAAPPVAAKTDFQVRLVKVPDGAKYKIIKELREVKPSLSLMETKGLVEKIPSVIADKVSKEEAEKIMAKLKAAGAELEMA